MAYHVKDHKIDSITNSSLSDDDNLEMNDKYKASEHDLNSKVNKSYTIDDASYFICPKAMPELENDDISDDISETDDQSDDCKINSHQKGDGYISPVMTITGGDYIKILKSSHYNESPVKLHDNYNIKTKILKPSASISPKKKINQKTQDVSKSDLINGIDTPAYKMLTSKNKDKFLQCSLCQKYYDRGEADYINNKYKNSMLTNENEITEGDFACFHCIFGLNYSPIEHRCQVDGVYGKTIFEYVLECHDYHDPQTCIRTSSCYLCDYKHGIKIEGIMLSDELYQSYKKEESDENINTDSDESNKFNDIEMTIDI